MILRILKFLFDFILYIPVNNFSNMSGLVFLVSTSTKQGLMCLAQGHNSVTLVRLKPASPRSQVKHSTTEPLCSLNFKVKPKACYDPKTFQVKTELKQAESGLNSLHDG